MAFGRDFLDELKSRVDLLALVGRSVRLQRRGREATGLCPFHKEKTPSFTVSADKGFYHCFGCGAHGGAIDFVMHSEGLSFPEAVEKLAQEAGLPVPRQTPEEARRESRRAGLLEALEAAAQWFEAQLAAPAGRPARAYLERRQVAPDTARRFRLGVAPARRTALKEAMLARGFEEATLLQAGLLASAEDGTASFDRFRDRLIFPIADGRGRVIAFGGRALGEARAKYLNSPETPLFHKGRTLYNLASAREAAGRAGTVIVAEGYMDVIALHQAGFAHAVAPLGTALTEEQIEALWRFAPEPVICLDGDAAGQRAAARAAERALPLLRPGQSLRFAELPPGEDPDSLLRAAGPAAVQATVEAASSLAGVLWRQATQQQAFDTPERRAGLRQHLGGLIRQIQDPTVRRYYAQHFDERLSEAFAPARPARQVQRQERWRPGAGGRRPPPLEVPLASRFGLSGAGQGVAVERERYLLALILNHSGLLDQIFEEFATLSLKTPILDSLRQQLLQNADSGDHLDLERLRTTSSTQSLAKLIDDLTGSQIRQRHPLLRSDAGLDKALEAWSGTYRVHLLAALEEEQRAAEVAFAQDANEENFRRLRQVQDAVEEARRATLSGTAEGLVPGAHAI